jgi:hypothetical protein
VATLSRYIPGSHLSKQEDEKLGEKLYDMCCHPFIQYCASPHIVQI